MLIASMAAVFFLSGWIFTEFGCLHSLSSHSRAHSHRHHSHSEKKEFSQPGNEVEDIAAIPSDAMVDYQDQHHFTERATYIVMFADGTSSETLHEVEKSLIEEHQASHVRVMENILAITYEIPVGDVSAMAKQSLMSRQDVLTIEEDQPVYALQKDAPPATHQRHEHDV